MRLFKQKKADTYISDIVPITHAVDNEILACGEGRQVAGFVLEGTSYLTKMPAELKFGLSCFVEYLRRLPTKASILTYCHRQKESVQLDGDFDDPFSKMFSARYSELLGQDLFKNTWTVLLIVEPQLKSAETSRLGSLLGSLPSKEAKESVECVEATRRLLNELSQDLLNSLSSYRPRRLNLDTDGGLLSTALLALNGGQHRYYPKVQDAFTFGESFADAVDKFADNPMGHLAANGVDKRIHFRGDTLIFEDCANTYRYAAALNVKIYPQESEYSLFDILYHAPFEFLMMHAFKGFSHGKSVGICDSKSAQIERNYAGAASVLENIEKMVDKISEGQTRLGAYHHNLLIFADSPEQLLANINELQERACKVGMILLREKLGMKASLYSMVPGLSHYANRVTAVTEKNFADFANFHVEQSGHKGDNHLKQPIAAMRTPAGSVAWFNCHATGSQHNPALGHTLMFGGSGGGKTVLLGFLMCQLQRFNGQLWVFDRNQGLEIAVRALGGSYSVLSPDNMPQLNPFQLPDTPGNRDFLVRLLATLLLRSGESEVPAKILNALTRCVEHAYSRKQSERSLRTATNVLPVDFERAEELRRWLRPNLNGALFDNETDSLSLGNIHGFDLTHFLQPSQSHALSALFQYLMHLMTIRLDGRLSTLIADEGWQWLLNPALSDIAREILVTWRKLNGHFVLATQDATTLATQSNLSATLITNTATKIFLPNAAASEPVNCESLGLTMAEHTWIKNASITSRQFLVKQSVGSTICELNLSGMQDFVSVFSANTTSIKMMKQAIAQKGDNPADWLPVFYSLVKSGG